MTRYSYGEQTRHYFDRPGETVPAHPIGGAAAWRGADVARLDDWRMRLDPAQQDEIRAALDHAEGTGRPTETLTAEDFPLPTLSGEIARWREAIRDGRGFQVVSGLPVDEWSQAQSERVFWCLGLHMGIPGAQNVVGDLIGHVTDTGDAVDDPFVRLYRTRADIAYHCDAADVVGLLCLRAARRGGASRIVSSVSVFDTLLAKRPDLVPRLFEPFDLDVRNEDPSGQLQTVPIPPCRFAEGVLRTFYHSDYFRSAERHAYVSLGASERELLDAYEAIASDPALFLDMELAPGDIQWLSNHSILHARTGYEDDEDPARKRHLLRLWLSLPSDEER